DWTLATPPGRFTMESNGDGGSTDCQVPPPPVPTAGTNPPGPDAESAMAAAINMLAAAAPRSANVFFFILSSFLESPLIGAARDALPARTRRETVYFPLDQHT